MDFVCRDFDSALHSLSQIMGVSEDKIISILEHDLEKQYDNDAMVASQSSIYDIPFLYDFGDYILQKGFPDIKVVVERPTIHWFHGARAIAPDDYLRYGIHPLSKMYPQIKQIIDNIALNLNIKPKECESKLQKHNKWLAEFKISDSEAHGGPFAMLMYEAVSIPERFGNHSYIDEPEIISNYAYMMYDKEADLILEEFKRISEPIIVEFIEPCAYASAPMAVLITTAIRYLYNTIHNKEENSQCNACFSNKGKLIPPERIVRIHRLNEN